MCLFSCNCNKRDPRFVVADWQSQLIRTRSEALSRAYELQGDRIKSIEALDKGFKAERELWNSLLPKHLQEKLDEN